MKVLNWLRNFILKNRKGLFLIILFFAALTSLGYSYRWRHRDTPTTLGVSYSVKYAEELGIDWQKGFLALLDDIEIEHYRLMSYWDRGEPRQDEYDFTELDWQIDQAERHNARVSLAIGQRQPRWPECHVPDWATRLETEEQYRQELLEYITQVINRYKDSPAVISYQVENEASNKRFGICPYSYDPDFLSEEIRLVRSIDPDTTIISNVSTQNGLNLIGPVSSVDKVGFTIYHNAHFEFNGSQYGWRYLFPSQWHSFRAAVIGDLKNVNVFVHELQAEPWGPEATVNLSSEEQAKTMNPEQLRAIVNYTEQSGIKEMYLWGGEWWYWRLTEFNDKDLWQTVRDIYSEAATQGYIN